MLSFRRATISDMLLYLEWRNEVSTRENSLSSELISEDTHQKWFYEKVNSSDCLMLLFESDNTPCGQVRLDLIDLDSYQISYSVAKDFRGLGLGKVILKIALDECRKNHLNDCKFIAHVTRNNFASIKTLESIGFQLDLKSESALLTYKIYKLF